MTVGLFLVIAAGWMGAGFVVRRWLIVGMLVVVWSVGVVIADANGSFAATAEDNSLGMFVFTAVPYLYWIAAFGIGVGLRRFVVWIKRPRAASEPITDTHAPRPAEP